jgi:hypothetical protein
MLVEWLFEAQQHVRNLLRIWFHNSPTCLEFEQSPAWRFYRGVRGPYFSCAAAGPASWRINYK